MLQCTIAGGRTKEARSFVSILFSSTNDDVTWKLLTLYKFSQINLCDVLSSGNIITKFQFVDHVIDLKQAAKKFYLPIRTPMKFRGQSLPKIQRELWHPKRFGTFNNGHLRRNRRRDGFKSRPRPKVLGFHFAAAESSALKVIPLKLFYYQTFLETWHN